MALFRASLDTNSTCVWLAREAKDPLLGCVTLPASLHQKNLGNKHGMRNLGRTKMTFELLIGTVTRCLDHAFTLLWTFVP